MVYTRKDIVRKIRQSTFAECPIYYRTNEVAVDLFTPESAQRFSDALAVLCNVESSVTDCTVTVPLNSSGHTLRVSRARIDSLVTIHQS